MKAYRSVSHEWLSPLTFSPVVSVKEIMSPSSNSSVSIVMFHNFHDKILLNLYWISFVLL